MTLTPLSSLERTSHPVSPSRVKLLAPAFYPFGAGVSFVSIQNLVMTGRTRWPCAA